MAARRTSLSQQLATALASEVKVRALTGPPGAQAIQHTSLQPSEVSWRHCTMWCTTWPTRTTIVVFTDNLTAIQLVSRMLYRPNSLRHHMHRGILQEILPRILARKGHTTICKVRAHVGKPGNAQADSLCRAAHAAAPGPDFVAATGSTAGPNWVLFEHQTPAGATELRQVTNLRRAYNQ